MVQVFCRCREDMGIKMKKIHKYLALLLVLAISVATVNYIDVQIVHAEETDALAETEPQPQQGLLKIMATADLHGQVLAHNFEIAREDSERGLSKLVTLIEAERALVASETVLLDAGDTLYSYETDFFYNYNDKLIQPLYQIMATLGYDAITLGNHELDYPWQYVLRQLEGSGFFAKTTVCNLLYDDTGDTAFAPSVVMEKEIVMQDGMVVPVKIGVVGATRESLSSKRQRYSGLLCGRSIYDSVSEEAKRLKEEGVDLVIALIHGGIGLVSSDETVSPGAKLAKLPQIDAVVTSHTHEVFPGTASEYEKFSYVEEEKGLIYGKPVVAVGSHAGNIGAESMLLTDEILEKLKL